MMQLPPVRHWPARLLPLTCLLSALVLQSSLWAQPPTPGPAPQPKTPVDVVREMAPPAANPQLGGRAARAKARDEANENVRKAEQERQQASNDAARNPNDASKQAKDLEAQQKLDQAVTDAAKLNDEVRTANDAYQNAYKEAETAANNLAADTPDKTLKLLEAKRAYEAALEAAKTKIARVFAPDWNRQRFAEQMERRRQATQQGSGTPQTQPGGTTPGTGTGDIGQTQLQTPPTAAQWPRINVITDIAGGGDGYNTSGYKFGWSGSYGKGDWSRWGDYQYAEPQIDLPPGGPKVAPVENVKVCSSVYGSGYYYIPGTDTCVKIGDPGQGAYRVDLGNGVSFHFQADNNQFIGLRSREPLNLPLIGTEKNTESGFQDGPLRCFPSNGSCIIEVPPQQGSTYGVPPIFLPDLNPQFQVRYGDYQYGGSVAEITGQWTFPPVQLPQGCQANAYDFSIGDQTYRQLGHRVDRNLGDAALKIALKYINQNLATSYPRTENDPGRDKEPALDAGAASGSALSERLPQARLDLRPPPTRIRVRR